VSPSISVIVPHLNDVDGLTATLAALADQSSLPDEVIVVDNGSDVGFEALSRIVSQHSLPARLIEEAERGAGPARNAGVAAAKGDIFAFIDCDCRPIRTWLATGIEALKKTPIVGGPVQVVWQGLDTPATAFDRLFGFNVAKSFARHRHLLTSNLLVTRQAFSVTGPFATVISEDVEWCHRAAARGLLLRFEPRLVVEHRALDSVSKLEQRWRRITRETWAYHRQRKRSPGAWLLYLFAILASVPVHAVKLMLTRDIASLGLKLRTISVLARVRLVRVWTGLKTMSGGPAG
jgi:glycosyltransferase involved in cell wall biosynthesis